MGAAIPGKPRCKRNCDCEADKRVAVIFCRFNFSGARHVAEFAQGAAGTSI
jgi:hypothetical protein